MIRAYDEYGNIVDILEWEKQIIEKAIDDFADKFISLCDDGEFMARINEFPATTILELAEQLKDN